MAKIKIASGFSFLINTVNLTAISEIPHLSSIIQDEKRNYLFNMLKGATRHGSYSLLTVNERRKHSGHFNHICIGGVVGRKSPSILLLVCPLKVPCKK